MDIEDARARCRDFAKAGMLRHHAQAALRRAKCDPAVIEEVIADYDALHVAYRDQHRLLVRLTSTIVFFVCAGAYAFFAFVPQDGWHVFHNWLMIPAALAFLKMLLP